MVNLNATSPQLAVVKSVVDAFSSCDITNNESFYSKDFKFQSFPKTVDHVEEAKEEHFKNYGGVVSTYTRSDPVFQKVVVQVCPSIHDCHIVSEPNTSPRSVDNNVGHS